VNREENSRQYLYLYIIDCNFISQQNCINIVNRSCAEKTEISESLAEVSKNLAG